MAASSSGRLKAVLALLVLVGIADLAFLNLYAAPRYVAEGQAAGTSAPESSAVARSTPQPTAPDESPEPAAEPSTDTSEPVAVATEAGAGGAAAAPEPTETAVAAAPPEPAPAAGPAVASSTRPRIPDLLFGTASAALQPRSKGLLLQVAKHMRATPGSRVLLQGHADERGPEALNEALSIQRARAAAAHLVSLGVSKEHVQIEGVGETMPADRGSSGASLERNRRVVVIWK